MHTLAKCMHEAYTGGYVAVMDGSFHKYNYKGCGDWNCVFLPISNCTDRNGARAKKREITVPSGLRDTPYAAAWIRGHFLAHAMRMIDEVRRESSCIASNVTVGLHIRRGDKLIQEARRFEVRDYMHHVDHFVHPKRIYHNHYDKNYNATIFVATDEPNVMTELQHKDYSPYTILSSHHEGVNYWHPDHLRNLLAEVDCLVQSEFFVGTFSSQISRLVYELKMGRGAYRGEQLHVASMDDDYYAI